MMPTHGWKPWRVDPVGCGCTECLTGESVPLDAAAQSSLKLMLAGVIDNATGFDLHEFDTEFTVYLPKQAYTEINRS